MAFYAEFQLLVFQVNTSEIIINLIHVLHPVKGNIIK